MFSRTFTSFTGLLRREPTEIAVSEQPKQTSHMLVPLQQLDYPEPQEIEKGLPPSDMRLEVVPESNLVETSSVAKPTARRTRKAAPKSKKANIEGIVALVNHVSNHGQSN